MGRLLRGGVRRAGAEEKPIGDPGVNPRNPRPALDQIRQEPGGALQAFQKALFRQQDGQRR